MTQSLRFRRLLPLLQRKTVSKAVGTAFESTELVEVNSVQTNQTAIFLSGEIVSTGGLRFPTDWGMHWRWTGFDSSNECLSIDFCAESGLKVDGSYAKINLCGESGLTLDGDCLKVKLCAGWTGNPNRTVVGIENGHFSCPVYETAVTANRLYTAKSGTGSSHRYRC